MKYVHLVLEYLRDNPAFTTIVVWPVLTAILTGAFGPRSAKEWSELKARSTWRYNVAQAFSRYGMDIAPVIGLIKKATSRNGGDIGS